MMVAEHDKKVLLYDVKITRLSLWFEFPNLQRICIFPLERKTPDLIEVLVFGYRIGREDVSNDFWYYL